MFRRMLAATALIGAVLLPLGVTEAQEPPATGHSEAPVAPAPGDTAAAGPIAKAPADHYPPGVTPPLLEFDKTQAVAINGAALSADETVVCGAPGPRRFLQELVTDNPLAFKVPYRLGDVVGGPPSPTAQLGRQYLLSGVNDGATLGAGDFPFDHPFGSDFNMDVDPDPEYAFLSQLAGAVVTNDQHTELSAGQFPHVPVAPLPAGTLWDDFSTYDRQNLQPGYVPQTGDRIIMQGRWVNDCGHPPFQTELHPFSFLAWARESGNRTISQGFYAPYRETQTYHPDANVANDVNNPNRYTLPNTYSFPQGLILSLFRIQDAGPAPYTSIDHLESFQVVEANTTPPPPYWVCAPASATGAYVGANWDLVTRPGVQVQVFGDDASGCAYVVTTFTNLTIPNPDWVTCSLPWPFLAEIASAEAGTPIDIKAELSQYVAPQYLSRMDPDPIMNCHQPVQGPPVSANPSGQNITVDASVQSPVYGRIEVFRTDVAPSLPSIPSSTASSSTVPGSSSSSTPAGQVLTVTPSSVARGGTIAVQSSGWAPGTTVTISLDGTVLGTLPVDPSGTISGSFTIPSGTALGGRNVSAAGTGNDGQPLSLVAGITVTSAIPTGNLPVTGASISRYVAIGCAFVLMGLGFVGLAGTRRRRI